MIFFFVINYYMRIRVINDMVIADINEGPSEMWCFFDWKFGQPNKILKFAQKNCITNRKL